MSTKYSGLEAALRSARMTFVSEAEAGDRTGTEIIACEDLLPAWTKEGPKGDGSHEVGKACTHEGQSWRCCQAHNTNNNPDIEPARALHSGCPTTPPTRRRRSPSFSLPWPRTVTRRARSVSGLMVRSTAPSWRQPTHTARQTTRTAGKSSRSRMEVQHDPA